MWKYYNKLRGSVHTIITNRKIPVEKSLNNKLLYVGINTFATKYNYLLLMNKLSVGKIFYQ